MSGQATVIPMDIVPVMRTREELEKMHGCLSAARYLMGRDREESHPDIVTALETIIETVGACQHRLDEAIREATTRRTEAGR